MGQGHHIAVLMGAIHMGGKEEVGKRIFGTNGQTEGYSSVQFIRELS